MSSLVGLEYVPISPLKQDPALKHCQILVGDEQNGVKVELKKCIYCGKTFKGGGIHRIKEHLAGRKGNGPTCDHVPEDVRLSMQQSLNDRSGRRKKQRGNPPLLSNYSETNNAISDQCKSIRVADSNLLVNQEEEFGTVNMNIERRKRDRDDISCAGALGTDKMNDSLELRANLTPSPWETDNAYSDYTVCKLSGASSSNLSVYEEDVGINNTSANGRKGPSATLAIDTIDNDGNTGNDIEVKRENYQKVHMAIGRFLFEIGASLDAVKNSGFFQSMIDTIASVGQGVPASSYHDLRGWVLKKAVEEVKSDADKHVATWTKTGCSLLVNKWNSRNGRILLNFSVCSPEGTVFLKSVDASDIIYSSGDLHELLKQVVEEVGVTHILQVITDSEEQYTVAGKRLMATYPTLYWAPCAAHCIDLMLEDFGKLEWISSVIDQARSITQYIYKHRMVLNMMRRYTFGNDTVKPGTTRFATNFTTLKQMADRKGSPGAQSAPQLLRGRGRVGAHEWIDCSYSKKLGGLAMLDLISNQSFWSSCILINCLIDPLLQVLRIVCSKTDAIAYIYAGLYRAKEAIKRELVKREAYIVYWNIIDHSWEQQRQLPLHAAGFCLNPKFFYRVKGDMHNKILSGMFDCIESLVPDINIQDKIIKEINLYQNGVGDLGRKIAIRARDTLLPVEWWSTCGGCCANLARLAIRILNQSCSIFGCEQNYIPFEPVHGTRNCLEHQRLSDLTFVKYNLRLKQMAHHKKEEDPIDPISFDVVDIVEDWVTEDEFWLEDYGSSDWRSLEPPSINMMPIGPPIDEVEIIDPVYVQDSMIVKLSMV
ncbi:HAT transposon superfamily [Quillaja saponaria]|uniref:HAT transposon superfamily n=1 Tax=Quillaja saponaria TaxID=32244 RepID=A0AAD7LMI8_QUISA|nr:HAT transposon superfamily [Quillaja saponaria]